MNHQRAEKIEVLAAIVASGMIQAHGSPASDIADKAVAMAFLIEGKTEDELRQVELSDAEREALQQGAAPPEGEIGIFEKAEVAPGEDPEPERAEAEEAKPPRKRRPQ